MSTLKYSRQREAIKTFLKNRTDHPTADTVYTCLREAYPNISLGTVYRNLSLLEQLGEISRISTGDSAEHYDGNMDPHQHFICSHCHKVYDVRIPEIHSLLGKAVENVPGKIEAFHATFYGVCHECQKEPITLEHNP